MFKKTLSIKLILKFDKINPVYTKVMILTGNIKNQNNNFFQQNKVYKYQI